MLTGLSWGYNLNESLAGAVANDVLGLNNLTAVNGPGGTPAKISDGRLFVAANSQKLTAASAAAFQLGGNTPFTIAGWLKFTTIANFPGIVGKWHATDTEWVLFYNTSTNRFEFSVCTAAGGVGRTDAVANTFGAATTGVPYFVAVRYDLSAIHISVNAGAEDSVPFTAGVFAGSTSFDLAFEGNSSYLDGWLDEFYGWKRDIGTAGISALYNGGAGSTYPFVGIP
jgi:hypothetical protein